MNIEITKEERELLIQALEHYDAYLHATGRKDGHAKDLAERLRRQRATKQKPVERQTKEAHRRQA